MISRIEFYICFIIVTGLIAASIFSTESGLLEIKKAELQIRDSMLAIQKDSAFARAMQYEMKADSLQALINRKKLDIQNIHKKYENEKKNILLIDADSSLSFFARAVTH